MASRVLGWATFVLVSLGTAGCQSTLPQVTQTSQASPPAFPGTTPAPVAASAPAQKPEVEADKSHVHTVSAILPETPDGHVAVAIRAKVNNRLILEEDLQLRMLSFPYLPDVLRLPEPRRSDTLKKILDTQLEQLIDREVILSELYRRLEKNPKALKDMKAKADKEFAKKLRTIRANSKVTSDDELKEMMRKQGLSLEALRRQTECDYLAKEFMMTRLWPAMSTINFADVRDYYEAHKEEFQTADRVEWQYLFVAFAEGGKYKTRDDARRFAEHLRQRIEKGEDFAGLAKNFDDGFSKMLKSAGVGNKRGEIKPAELESPLFALREGQVGPVVEAAQGFHVFRVTKREVAGQMPFDVKVQKQIRDQLRNEAAGREYRKIIEEFKRDATIEIIRGPAEAPAAPLAPPPIQRTGGPPPAVQGSIGPPPVRENVPPPPN